MAVHVKLTLSPNTVVAFIGGEVILGSTVREESIQLITLYQELESGGGMYLELPAQWMLMHSPGRHCWPHMCSCLNRFPLHL